MEGLEGSRCGTCQVHTVLRKFLESFRQFLREKSSPSGVSVPKHVALRWLGQFPCICFVNTFRLRLLFLRNALCWIVQLQLQVTSHTQPEKRHRHGTVDFNNTTVLQVLNKLRVTASLSFGLCWEECLKI